MPKPFVPIIMGSKSDLLKGNEIKEDSNPAIIAKILNDWRIGNEFRVGSAHKNSPYLMKMIKEYRRNY